MNARPEIDNSFGRRLTLLGVTLAVATSITLPDTPPFTIGLSIISRVDHMLSSIPCMAIHYDWQALH